MDNGAQNKKVAVIGAGFSGLVTGYYLLRAGFKVEIFESKDRPGGLIHTYKTENGLVETAANGLLNCNELESLCHEVGVELLATNLEARKRYIFRRARPRRWPLQLGETLKLLWFLIRYIIFRKSVAPRKHETVSNWGARVLGAKASQYSIETAVLGIYATDARTLSASLVLKRLFEREQRAQTDLKFGGGTVSPKNGMGDLVDGIASYLQVNGAKIQYGHEIGGGSAALNSSEYDWIVVATSADCAAGVLRMLGDSRAPLVDRISMLPMTSTTVFTKPLNSARVEGFGVLFPEVDHHLALGVLFQNHIFQNRTINCQADTWITPGAELRDQTLIDSILSERMKVLKQNVELLEYKVNRWPKALPHYNLELEEILQNLNPLQGKVALMGNYLGEIGLKQILLRAKKLTDQLARISG